MTINTIIHNSNDTSESFVNLPGLKILLDKELGNSPIIGSMIEHMIRVKKLKKVYFQTSATYLSANDTILLLDSINNWYYKTRNKQEKSQILSQISGKIWEISSILA